LANKHHFSTSKHTQLIAWFNKNFVRTGKIEPETGKFVHLAFDRRMDGDYNIFSEYCYNDVAEDLEYMKKTIAAIEELIYSEEKRT
jgi:hypothetical protein